MNINKVFPGGKIGVLFLGFLFIAVGCKQKSEENKTESTRETSQGELSKKLYESETFTKAGGFPSGIEGPAVDFNGVLYAVNYEKPGTVGRVDLDGQVTLFITLPDGSVGNGIRFNSKGKMLIADYTKHNILKVDMDTEQIDVFAHNDKMNQPNDIAITDNDILFASDPDWKNSKGQIWKIDRDGKFTLLEKDMGTANGIEVSPDNKTLYVNESVQRNVWAYDLSPQGEISNKRLLIKFEDFGMDGMRTDIQGNLYIARYGKGTVAKISPQGDILQEITLAGKSPSNIAFGGKDGKTVYVTLQDNGNIESFRVEDEGRAFNMLKSR
ncbi:SMP-30/gluconolactonase/LRE family protein [Flavobacteriaceae bacterium F89]|uniref:SMP-30/gluconolactonase/LRE family protein n=1 Tax=Cerina litoralis TaxID=2874477 RepID=A0AAE3EQV6_9FLAO|nr:SMP-30/gluconolactonase/LRE family protein [Cerina litoralis]MCG2459323.1 SMP-30/gluconolactonase/LRE family protein [Cerina litoralis]